MRNGGVQAVARASRVAVDYWQPCGAPFLCIWDEVTQNSGMRQAWRHVYSHCCLAKTAGCGCGQTWIRQIGELAHVRGMHARKQVRSPCRLGWWCWSRFPKRMQEIWGLSANHRPDRAPPKTPNHGFHSGQIRHQATHTASPPVEPSKVHYNKSTFCILLHLDSFSSSPSS